MNYLKFLPVAEAYAALSKDKSTKVGALILGTGGETRAQGWNGAPRGCRADVDERSGDRESKLLWTIHAEANAIANAARAGVSTVGCILVVTHYPCMNCAKLVVQAGIAQIITRKPPPEFAQRWARDIQASHELFMEAGIHCLAI